MNRKILVLILVVSLVCGWGGLCIAGELGYKFKSSGMGLIEPRAEPNSPVVAADAAIARPLGLATTIAGTGLFIVTLPFTLPSGTAGDAAWNLIGRPGGWTFDRPLGRSAPRYEDKGVF